MFRYHNKRKIDNGDHWYIQGMSTLNDVSLLWMLAFLFRLVIFALHKDQVINCVFKLE